MRIQITIALLMTLGSASVFALPEPLADGLRHCAAETDRDARLACYDTLATSTNRLEADRVGMTVAIAQQRDPQAVKRAESVALAASIAGLDQARSGEWILTLDNGQVWIQAEPKPGMRFEVGEQIEIKHGAMSSLWLSAAKGRTTRVRRIR